MLKSREQLSFPRETGKSKNKIGLRLNSQIYACSHVQKEKKSSAGNKWMDRRYGEQLERRELRIPKKGEFKSEMTSIRKCLRGWINSTAGRTLFLHITDPD